MRPSKPKIDQMVVQKRNPITQRLIASALFFAVLFGATGCGMLVDQNAYRSSAGDGVNIEGVGPLSVRNVLVVADEEGGVGQLIAAIVNSTDEDHVLHIEVGEDSPATLEIPVPADSIVSFGQRGDLEDPPLIEGLDAVPGSTVRMYFQAGEAEGTVEDVPVLDGCLGYLRGLEPGERRQLADCPWFDAGDA
jgi:hypothetical protein